MFKRILVPVDLTEKSLAAVDVAFDFARQFKSQVTLLHVDEPARGAWRGKLGQSLSKSQPEVAQNDLRPHLIRDFQSLTAGRRNPDLESLVSHEKCGGIRQTHVVFDE
jgi:nucleotide-binding universal stress UspA family protein